MNTIKSICMQGTILLAACWLGGCASPAPLSLGDYFSTFDHERVEPSERVLRHGPYKLEVYPMVASLQGHSIFYAPKRNDDAWHRAPPIAHTYREKLERTSEEHVSHPKRPDAPDLVLGTAWQWMSTTNEILAHLLWASETNEVTPVASFRDFACAPNHPDPIAQAIGMGTLFRCWVFGGKNANSRFSGHDFPAMRRYTVQKHPVLFPEAGRGKRLDLAAVNLFIGPSEDPDVPCHHTIRTVYQRGGKVPLPKFSYTSFSMYNGQPSPCGGNSPLAWNEQTGTAVLKTMGGDVPLHVPAHPLTKMDESFLEYSRNLMSDRFAASVIQLLNGMTDEQLDALEEVEWGPDEYKEDKADYDNGGIDYRLSLPVIR